MQEEITSLEVIKDVGQLELLAIRLPELVGSPLSINALAHDLQINHGTLSRWLDVLERMYGIYRLGPFGAPKLQAVKKAQKHYHYDWSTVLDLGALFENFLASHLLKWCHYQQDALGLDVELRYFRDRIGA